MTTGLKEAILEFFPGNPLARAPTPGRRGRASMPGAAPSRTLTVPRACYISQGKPLNIHSPRVPCYMCYMCYISQGKPLNIHSPRVPCYMCYMCYISQGKPLNIQSPRVPCYMCYMCYISQGKPCASRTSSSVASAGVRKPSSGCRGVCCRGRGLGSSLDCAKSSR